MYLPFVVLTLESHLKVDWNMERDLFQVWPSNDYPETIRWRPSLVAWRPLLLGFVFESLGFRFLTSNHFPVAIRLYFPPGCQEQRPDQPAVTPLPVSGLKMVWPGLSIRCKCYIQKHVKQKMCLHLCLSNLHLCQPAHVCKYLVEACLCRIIFTVNEARSLQSSTIASKNLQRWTLYSAETKSKLHASMLRCLDNNRSNKPAKARLLALLSFKQIYNDMSPAKKASIG